MSGQPALTAWARRARQRDAARLAISSRAALAAAAAVARGGGRQVRDFLGAAEPADRYLGS